MTFKSSLILVTVLGSWAMAEAQQGESLDLGLQTAPQTVKVVSAQEAPVSGDRILILNSNTADTSVASRVQNQPTTFVDASPLSESRAEQIRRARKNAEINTEQKIVEKLEASRLEDERRRAERLFGDRWAKAEQPKVAESVAVAVAPVVVEPVQVVPVVAAPVVVEVATPVVAEDNTEEMKNEILQELRDDLKASTTAAKSATMKPEKKDRSFYISGHLGTGDYPDAYNIEPELATGLSVGGEVSQNFFIEATYMYSQYFINESYWRDRYGFWKQMDQHNFQIAGRYALFSGMIQPTVGAIASYTFRKYKSPGTAWGRGGYSYEDGDSNAIDIGPAIGVDFKFADNFALGADLRYMFNVTNSRNSEYLSSRYYSYENEEPVERMSYYSFTISGKLYF